MICNTAGSFDTCCRHQYVFQVLKSDISGRTHVLGQLQKPGKWHYDRIMFLWEKVCNYRGVVRPSRSIAKTKLTIYQKTAQIQAIYREMILRYEFIYSDTILLGRILKCLPTHHEIYWCHFWKTQEFIWCYNWLRTLSKIYTQNIRCRCRC
jgi:hypothetical protein